MSDKIKCEVCGRELDVYGWDYAACDRCGKSVCKGCYLNTGDDEFLCAECRENEEKERS